MDSVSEGSIPVSDIEHSPEYQALLVAAAGKPERSMGESVIPAEPPNWTDVKNRALALITDPPHLAVLIQLVKSRTNVDGFTGFGESLKLIVDHLSSSWDDVHPLADQDDPDDPFYERVNLLRELSDEPAFIDAIYRAPLVSARAIGTFSRRDIEISSGKIPASEEELARCQEGLVRGAFAETDPDDLRATHAACVDIQSMCDSIKSLFDERAGDHGLLFTALQSKVAECQTQLEDYGAAILAALESESPEPAEELAAPASDTAEPVGAQTAGGATLTDRESVCATLDQIIVYYQRYEPSSPVPVLIQRARDMAAKSFF